MDIFLAYHHPSKFLELKTSMLVDAEQAFNTAKLAYAEKKRTIRNLTFEKFRNSLQVVSLMSGNAQLPPPPQDQVPMAEALENIVKAQQEHDAANVH